MRRTWKLLLPLVVLAVVAFPVPNTYAGQQVITSAPMSAKLEGTVTTTDCSNSPGPWITFEGNLALGGLTVRLLFNNNVNKDVHTAEGTVTADVTVFTPGGRISIPKQPVRGGAAGNPFIWIQLVEANGGKALSDEIYLGRCVQGTFDVSPATLQMLATALAEVSVADCTNNPGPFIYVDGGLGLANGLAAKFIFRNNDNPVGGPHEADAMASVVLVPAAWDFKIAKQPVQGGAGGNPSISVQFFTGNSLFGDVTEYLLGRCVQLLPGNSGS